MMTARSLRWFYHQATRRQSTADEEYVITTTAKRVSDQPKMKTRKYLPENQFIFNLVLENWERGTPLSKIDLREHVLRECSTFSVEWKDHYGPDIDPDHKKLHVFMDRALEKIGFVARDKTISQIVPKGWRTMAESGAKRIRTRFLKEDVNVVLAADELFVRFNETVKNLIVPIGVKRVGTKHKCDEKIGCTVLPTMDLTHGMLMPPVIIFTGVFCAKLMEQWSKYQDSLVLFNTKHWMTSETFGLYLGCVDHEDVQKKRELA
jgi:hypothetical protein